MKIVVNICVLIALVSCSSNEEHSREPDPFTGVVSGSLDTIQHTVFLPTWTEKFDYDVNAVYCPTLAMAFNQFKPFVGKVNTASGVIAPLLTQLVPHDVIEEESYLAMLGRGEDADEQINDALSNKFEGKTFSWDGCNDSTLLAYAYLEKYLSFEYVFEDWDDLLKFNDTLVHAFGIWRAYGEEYSKLVDQFNLVYYKSDEEFIIELLPTDNEHIIVLAKIPRHNSLSSIFSISEGLIQKHREDTRLYPFNHLWIPRVGFDFTRNYKEYKDAFIYGSKDSVYIFSAMQQTRFLLNEKGAEIKSEAVVEANTEEEEPEVPKELEFNGPFYIYLTRKERTHPYFMMYVSNTEIMQRTNAQ